MKRIPLILPVTLVVLCLCVGCTSKESLIENPNQINLTTRSHISDASIANDKHRILQKQELYLILDNKFASNISSYRRGNRYSIETVTENGKTLLHIANLADGGWAIVAGDVREENQILAYGESGEFDPENISNPGIAFWYESVKEQMRQIEYEATDDSIESNPTDDNGISVHSISYDEPYLWVRRYLGVTTTRETKEVNHLIQTKWGQGRPWNYRIHNECPTGCVAVAVSQMLYYLHFNIGLPNGLYHNVIPSWRDENGYIVSSLARSDYAPNSERWEQMAKTAKDSQRTTGTDYVGDLMLEVGNRLNMKYSYYNSVTGDDASVFSYYNLKCDTKNYNYNLIKESLDDNTPMIVFGTTENGGIGHSWIIDGYREYSDVSDYQYKWVLMPPDSLDYHLKYYKDIDIDHIFTEEEKQRNHPELVEDEIVHEYSSYYEKYVKMNWGYDGEWDDGQYSILPSDKWKVDGGRAYNKNVHIFYNFRPL